MDRREFLKGTAAAGAAAAVPITTQAKEEKLEYCSCGSGNAAILERLPTPGGGRWVMPSYICPNCKKHRRMMDPGYRMMDVDDSWEKLPVVMFGPPSPEYKEIYPDTPEEFQTQSIINAKEIFDPLPWEDCSTDDDARPNCYKFMKKTCGWICEKDSVHTWVFSDLRVGHEVMMWGKVKMILNASGAIHFFPVEETNIKPCRKSTAYNPELERERNG